MIDSDDSKKFFSFLVDVLGVKQILTPAANQAPAGVQLIISVSELNTYTTDEKDLLEKMITALQLVDISYHVQDIKVGVSDYGAFHLILADQIHTGPFSR